MNSDKYDSDVWPNEYVFALQRKVRELNKRIAALEAENINNECVIYDLRAEVAALKEAQRWIPVSERLPDTDMVELYEVVIRNKKGHRFRQEGYWQSSEWEIPASEQVEYWREIDPLPAPPKEQC